jgi:hypothetical protein
MKKHIAYVMQDDALYGVLTVRENLFYSAALRLPQSMSIEGFFSFSFFLFFFFSFFLFSFFFFFLIYVRFLMNYSR